jgi:AraC-like DNA-binding protein/tetratricopeptide (TPR) repeat protein
LGPLLGHIADNLFDPSLNVNQMKRACSVRNNSVPVQFHSMVGMPPGAYISDCRLGVAARLLRGTELPVWEIGELVGYSTLQVFSEAFARWSGLRPSVYRQKNSEGANIGSMEGPDLLDPDTLRKACAGALSPQEGKRLIRALQDVYRSQSEAAEEDASVEEGVSTQVSTADEAMATAVWERIQHLSSADQQNLVKERYRFTTPALFDLLRRKSREIGLNHRQRGIELAELALESLYACGRSIPEPRLLNLRTRGWAWLANAKRMAFDLTGAEIAFAAAEGNLPKSGASRFVLAELLELKASLRYFQNRMTEATELQDRAVALFRRVAQPEPLAHALITKATILYHYKGASAEALPALAEARQLLEHSNNTFLRFCLLNNLSHHLLEAQEVKEAAKAVEEARLLTTGYGSSYSEAHLSWSEALLQQSLGREERALALFRQSMHTFLSLDLAHHAAGVSLDLAILHLQQRNEECAIQLIGEMLPTLATPDTQQIVLPALDLLKEAYAAGHLPLSVLQAMRQLWRGSSRPTI